MVEMRLKAWWDMIERDARKDQPISVAIIKPANSSIDCSWEDTKRCSLIFESIFASQYSISAWVNANFDGMFERRSRVACFKIITAAFTIVRYTLGLIKKKYQGSNDGGYHQCWSAKKISIRREQREPWSKDSTFWIVGNNIICFVCEKVIYCLEWMWGNTYKLKSQGWTLSCYKQD